jgi:hypothetical protein
VVHVAIGVAGIVAHINDLGSRVVNVDVFDVIHRARRWNLLDLRRDLHRHPPGAESIVGLVPNAFVSAVVLVVVAEHLEAGVDVYSVLELSFFYFLEASVGFGGDFAEARGEPIRRDEAPRAFQGLAGKPAPR